MSRSVSEDGGSAPEATPATTYRSVQELVTPRLAWVRDRANTFTAPSRAADQLAAGDALAILGPPGANLERIASDVIRALRAQPVTVWIDLAELSRRIPGAPPSSLYSLSGTPSPASSQSDALLPGGAWDQQLDRMLLEGMSEALAVDGMSREQASELLKPVSTQEEPRVARIQQFAARVSASRRAPVLAFKGMHRLPWKVCARLQWSLRKVLDNADNERLLRLVLTASSDFLTGEGPEEDMDFATSPLIERTHLCVLLPYTRAQLAGLAPLPEPLDDALIDRLHILTGGVIGLTEVVLEALVRAPWLATPLIELTASGQPPAWLWSQLVHTEGLSEPARKLLREGLGAFISDRKRQVWHAIDALERLCDDKEVEADGPDTLLSLELAGLARVEREGPTFKARFHSPLVPALLDAVLPPGERLRERLDAFRTTFSWTEFDPTARSSDPGPSIRITGAGRVHVNPTQPPVKLQATPEPPPPAVPARKPLDLPQSVLDLMGNPAPEASERLVELLLAIASSLLSARQQRNEALLTVCQLQIDFHVEAPAALPTALPTALPQPTIDPRATLPGIAALPSTNPNPAPAARGPAPVPRGKWEVRLLDPHVDETLELEASTLFLGPGSYRRWLTSRTAGNPFVPDLADDAYAFGIMTGLLLASQLDNRLIVQEVERRLTNSFRLGVGPLLRMLRKCLSPNTHARPGIAEIRDVLFAVLEDKYRPLRQLLRVLAVTGTAAGAAAIALDMYFDSRSANRFLFYETLRYLSVSVPAAFYFVARLVLDRSSKDDVNMLLWMFIKQRWNRLRWLAIPCLVGFSLFGVFGYRLYYNRAVELALASNEKLEEVLYKDPRAEGCTSVQRFATPASQASLRLWLNRGSYVFLLKRESRNGPQPITRYWSAPQVREQLAKKWGDTLFVYSLPPQPEDLKCVPDGVINTAPTIIPASVPAPASPSPASPTPDPVPFTPVSGESHRPGDPAARPIQGSPP